MVKSHPRSTGFTFFRPDDPHELQACRRKIGYYRDQAEVLAKLQGNGAGACSIYRCPACDLWHLATVRW